MKVRKISKKMNKYRQKKICYILSYYSPDYIRTRTIVAALKSSQNTHLFEARNTRIGWLRYLQTITKLIKVRILHDPDLYILGFRGHEMYWLIRPLVFGKPLIFDSLMSPYDSLLNEKKMIKSYSLLERLFYIYEKSIFKNAHRVLTDTKFHQDYFSELFNVPKIKIMPVPVGADESMFKPIIRAKRSNSLSNDLRLLFYGSFLPLHGVDIILEAAKQLRSYPVKFTLIGGGRIDLSGFHKSIIDNNLTNITHHEWVKFDVLPELIDQHDCGLGGPFGDTNQGRRVITGKTFQFLAMGKAVIIGKIDHDYGFIDKRNCLLVQQGSSDALVKAIAWALHHKEQLEAIGRSGFMLYQEKFSLECIQKKLETIIATST